MSSNKRVLERRAISTHGNTGNACRNIIINLEDIGVFVR
jgi:hypothetical protein